MLMIEFHEIVLEAAATAIIKSHVQQIVDLVRGNLLWEVNGSEIIYEDPSKELQLEDLAMEPSQMKDHQPQELLTEFKDCFAWSYEDMPELNQKLAEHRLPIKDDFKPYKQPARRMSKEVEAKVKEEIEKLVKAGFIRPIRYAEWLSNVVSMMKKNGKLRVCIYFRDLNRVTPKDVYVMPIADMLVDSVANTELLSFMDGYSGYIQINIVEVDTAKTAFRCPRAIGTFERLVMPFGLKNAGATYQREMNAIFHDMIKHFIEVYIDDIVVKSKKTEDHVDHLNMSFERMRKLELKMNPLKCAWRICKWSLVLEEFTLVYYPQKSMKRQTIADFLAHHPGSDESILKEVEIPVYGIEVQPWILKFDGSIIEGTASTGMMIISPTGMKTSLSFNLDFPCTNNQAEYEKLVIGLEVFKDLQAKNVQMIGDSHMSLAPYFTVVSQLADDLEKLTSTTYLDKKTGKAIELAQIASGLKFSEELTHRLVLIQNKNHPSITQRRLQVENFNLDDNLAGDWREGLKEALQFPKKSTPYGLRMKSLKYMLVEGDLYRKGMNGLMLRCIGSPRHWKS
ncbi:uncharacterized protein [Henckelia pumila]|uniref:uncharacterized protein n=1 Tax=Henckelia pumila TaxID=405737 RepID=UPI003C6DF4AA